MMKLTIEIDDVATAVRLLSQLIEPPVANGPYTETEPLPTVPYEAPAVPYTAPTIDLPTAPVYTLAQIAKAGAELLTSKPAMQEELVALLGRYGAKTVQQLSEDRLGDFAAELKQMGAKL